MFKLFLVIRLPTRSLLFYLPLNEMDKPLKSYVLRFNVSTECTLTGL